MGFNDRLKQLGSGIGNLFMAPIGLLWDSMRAIPDPEFDPGIGGLFGPAVNRATTGLAQVSEATGLSALGRDIAAATPIDEALGQVLRQGELIYNAEFQKQEGEAPLGLGHLGVAPGTVSISRPLGTLAGSVGAIAGGLAPGGLPAGETLQQAFNVPQQWKRAGETSVGRQLVDNGLGLYSMSKAERDKIQSEVWYNVVTGTVDAVSRWFTQPEILAGKGIKVARSRYIISSEKLAERAGKMWKNLDFEAIPESGYLNLQLKSKKPGGKLYAVTRASAYDDMQTNGILRVPQGADEAYEAYRASDERIGKLTNWPSAQDMGLSTEEMQTRFISSVEEVLDDLRLRYQRRFPDLAPDELEELVRSADISTFEDLLAYYQYKGAASRWAAENLPESADEALDQIMEQYLVGSSPYDIPQGPLNPDELYQVSDSLIPSDWDLDLIELGAGSSLIPLKPILKGNFLRLNESRARRDINQTAAGKGLYGSASQPMPIAPNPNNRAIYLLDESDFDEAMRYSSALYMSDPTDMPLILEIDADGIPVIFEDYYNPLLPDYRTQAPSDASLMTMVDAIPPEKISRVIRPEPTEMDTNMRVGMDIPDYLQPGGRVHNRLFNPDGTPIEPGDLLNIDEFGEDFLTASNLWSESPELAQKFLKKRAQEKALASIPESDNPIWRAMNARQTQTALNWMDGRSAEEIRRVLFPEHHFGQILSDLFSNAKTYNERRSILAASMGMRLPEMDTLPAILQTRLKVLTQSLDDIQAGRPVGRMYRELMSEDLTRMDPESAQQYVSQAITEIQDDLSQAEILRDFTSMGGVLEQVPRVSKIKALGNYMRHTEFYQSNPLARPIRSVTEYRPHEWVNVRDPMSDVQLVRQLEEAIPIGVRDSTVRELHNRYLAAGNDTQRIAILEESETEILRAAAKHAGVAPEDIAVMVKQMNQNRRFIKDFLTSRRYGPDGTDLVAFHDDITGEAVVKAMPLLSTQTQAWVPMADVRAIIAQSSELRRFKAQWGYLPKELLDSFNHLWKPTVLLRGGWMLRVVSDEQLRILAKTGSLWHHLAAISLGDTPQFTSTFAKNLTPGQRTAAAFATATGTQPIVATGVRASRAMTKLGIKLKRIDPELYRFMEDAGTEGLVSSRASFGGPNESIIQDFQAIFGRTEAGILDHLITRGTGEWRSINFDDPGYPQAWTRVLNNQIGRDPLAQVLIKSVYEGKVNSLSPEEIITNFNKAGMSFLKTPKGKEIAERMPWRSAKPDRWLEELYPMLEQYTAGWNDEILSILSNGNNVPISVLDNIDEAIRPRTIHAEVIAQTMGTSAVSQYIKDMLSSSFDLMGRLPTDTLSRQPFFREMYAREMKRLSNVIRKQGGEITEDAIKRMDASARAKAINEVNKYLYNLAETSRFGQMMRFTMPFYPAWQEVLKVWGGLVAENPTVFGRGMLLWKAPNKANLVVKDDEGEEFIQLRLAEKTADKLGLTGWSKYLATGGVRFAKDSFNLVLNSPLPGVGPLVQVPINEVVKNKPELEESLRFLLPFGIRTDAREILMSPLVRQLEGELRGPDANTGYQRDFINALTWMDHQYRTGERTLPPTVEEAHDIAKKINTVRRVARLSSPSQPIFDSPLQPYIDIYRDLQDQLGPDQADEVFLNHYGNEFFSVTISRTVSKTGLPPTVNAEVARRQFEDLIEKYPEYGRMIVGDQALGEFSSAAFAAQLSKPVGDYPYSEAERSYRTPEIDSRTGRIIEVDRRIGWQEYVSFMDAVEIERKKRGLPNLSVAGARDLQAVKQSYIQALAEQYPSWWDDFNTRDDLKWDNRIAAFSEIAKNPLMEDRGDIEGLQVYLESRQMVLQELNRRKMSGGASTLDAITNQDLALLWETMVSTILSEYLEFEPLYFRYLEGDPVRLRSGRS